MITSITLSTSIKTSYRLGEEIDLNDAKIVAHFNNDTTQEITILESMITDFDTTTTGSRNLKITYIGHIITKNYSVSGLRMGKYIVVNEKFYLEGQLINTLTSADMFLLFSSDNVAKSGVNSTNTVMETGTWNYDLAFNVTLEIFDMTITMRIIDDNNLEITVYSGDPTNTYGGIADLWIMYLEYSMTLPNIPDMPA